MTPARRHMRPSPGRGQGIRGTPGDLCNSGKHIVGEPWQSRGKGRLINVYAKMESEVTYLYFEEILHGRKNKALRGCTFYKVTRPLKLDDVLKNVSRNDKTDITGAKMRVTAPEYPLINL